MLIVARASISSIIPRSSLFTHVAFVAVVSQCGAGTRSASYALMTSCGRSLAPSLASSRATRVMVPHKFFAGAYAVGSRTSVGGARLVVVPPFQIRVAAWGLEARAAADPLEQV